MTGKHANVLVIMTDQHDPMVAGYAGDAVVDTRHLDALADRSATFPNAMCASPIYSPSRASFLTGKDVQRTGFWGNHWVILPEDRTLPVHSSDNGYVTALIRKIHFGGRDRMPGCQNRHRGDFGPKVLDPHSLRCYLRSRGDGLTNEDVVAAREAYYACVDFVDDCIGALLRGLDEAGAQLNETPGSAWRSVREADWKYVEVRDDEPLLFDLANDPGELNNLAAGPAHAERCERMRRLVFSDFDWEGSDLSLAADEARVGEFRSGIQPTTPNQYHLPDGRVFDAEGGLYGSRWRSRPLILSKVFPGPRRCGGNTALPAGGGGKINKPEVENYVGLRGGKDDEDSWRGT